MCFIKLLPHSYKPMIGEPVESDNTLLSVIKTPGTPWGSGEGLLPLRKNRRSVALADHRRQGLGEPSTDQVFFGFDSRLVLGSPRVSVQQK